MDLRERKVIHLLKTVLGSGGRFSHRCRLSSSPLSQASEHGVVVVGAAVVAASLLPFFVSELVKKSHLCNII